MKYRFLVFGAGAIGTYLGASLIRQDHTVVFLERAADIQTLWEQGLRVELEGEVISIPEPQLIDNLNEIQAGTFDLAILALKTYHLEDMLPDLIRLRDQLPPLLCLQNGVESEKILVNALGADRVISGTVTTAVDRLGKGNIVVQRLRGMGLGGPHPLARELVPIFKQAGINCSYFPRAEQMKWSKLVTNLLGNASSAILDLPPSTIFSHPDLYQMELDQIRETLDVMKFSGIKPVNLPGVPVKLLALIIKWIPAWISQPLLSKLIGSGRGNKMPSFHKDLYNGIGKSELDQLNGAVIRAGKKLNIPTPVNDFLVQTLNSLIRGEEKLDKYAHKPELFLDQLAAGI
ncbi:MAG: 2-dehydropantoate 2-reductase [Anaerolineales bacterium]|nr:2-dehydropantoate 2-reductase [Anaerolineales bacterium]